MTNEQRMKNLEIPKGKIDVVLDTDAFTEIDDQFAIAYLLKSSEKLNTRAIYAAPFSYRGSPALGMERSYDEVLKLLSLMNINTEVLKGSDAFLESEDKPIVSPAALDLAKRVEDYSPENPLYVIAIGAITNIASAMLINPNVKENTVVVWLGGHAHHYFDTKEFNMRGDYAAARVVLGSGVPFIQLPCKGVVSAFTISKPELEHWLVGTTPVADYLSTITITEAESYAHGKPWTRPIWDVTAVAWLLNEDDKFMLSRKQNLKLPDYDGYYGGEGPVGVYVYYILRDALMHDLINKLTS